MDGRSGSSKAADFREKILCPFSVVTVPLSRLTSVVIRRLNLKVRLFMLNSTFS